MNKKKVIKIFEIFKLDNSSPTTELNYKNTFELLISVILSAQSTDTGVNKATEKLFMRANSANSMYALGVNGIKEYIKTIGLYNNKAENIFKTCAILQKKYDGKVPDTMDELIALPGVGRKTANVILNTAFGKPAIAVDTHIFRVSNRIGIAPGKTVLEVEKGLLASIPSEYIINAHHWLILHGRYVCKAKKPDCQSCAILKLCEYSNKS